MFCMMMIHCTIIVGFNVHVHIFIYNDDMRTMIEYDVNLSHHNDITTLLQLSKLPSEILKLISVV